MKELRWTKRFKAWWSASLTLCVPESEVLCSLDGERAWAPRFSHLRLSVFAGFHLEVRRASYSVARDALEEKRRGCLSFVSRLQGADGGM